MIKINVKKLISASLIGIKLLTGFASGEAEIKPVVPIEVSMEETDSEENLSEEVLTVVSVEEVEEVEENSKYTRADFEEDVRVFMRENNILDYESASKIVAYNKKDILLETDPEFLFEKTGVYESVMFTEEKFDELVEKFGQDAFNKSVKYTKDVPGFTKKLEEETVAIINLGHIFADFPHLIENIFGDQPARASLRDTFYSLEYIRDVNIECFKAENSAANFINYSDYVLDMRQKMIMKKVEGLIAEALQDVENAETVNAKAAEIEQYLHVGQGRYASDSTKYALRNSLIVFDNVARNTLNNEYRSKLQNMYNGETVTYVANIMSFLNDYCGYTEEQGIKR